MPRSEWPRSHFPPISLMWPLIEALDLYLNDFMYCPAATRLVDWIIEWISRCTGCSQKVASKWPTCPASQRPRLAELILPVQQVCPCRMRKGSFSLKRFPSFPEHIRESHRQPVPKILVLTHPSALSNALGIKYNKQLFMNIFLTNDYCRK